MARFAPTFRMLKSSARWVLATALSVVSYGPWRADTALLRRFNGALPPAPPRCSIQELNCAVRTTLSDSLNRSSRCACDHSADHDLHVPAHTSVRIDANYCH